MVTVESDTDAADEESEPPKCGSIVMVGCAAKDTLGRRAADEAFVVTVCVFATAVWTVVVVSLDVGANDSAATTPADIGRTTGDASVIAEERSSDIFFGCGEGLLGATIGLEKISLVETGEREACGLLGGELVGRL